MLEITWVCDECGNQKERVCAPTNYNRNQALSLPQGWYRLIGPERAGPDSAYHSNKTERAFCCRQCLTIHIGKRDDRPPLN